MLKFKQECDKCTKQCIDSHKIPPGTGYILPDCCRMHLMSMLMLIPYIMDGLDYWIDFGTLLGFTRDGKIIDWDDDIDISVKASTFGELERLQVKKRAECNGLIYTDYPGELTRLL